MKLDLEIDVGAGLPAAAQLEELSSCGEVSEEFGGPGGTVPTFDEFDPGMVEHLAQRLAGRTRADRREEGDVGAEVFYGGSGEGGSARISRGVFGKVDGHRAVGRHSVDAALDIAFDHGRADHENSRSAKAIDVIEKGVSANQRSAPRCYSARDIACFFKQCGQRPNCWGVFRRLHL